MGRNDLGAIFGAFFGRPLNMALLDHRIALQKLIFMLQNKKNSHLGSNYSFNWYLRGPYSPDLSKDAFGAPQSEEIQISKESNDDITKLRNLIGHEVKDFDKQLDKLELFASVLYLLNAGLNEETILDTIRKTKPWYKEDDIKEVIRRFS